MPSYKFFKEPIFNTDSVIRKTNDDGSFIWIPISVDNKNLTYDQESLEINSTEWAFSNYAVANSLYLPVPDIINKIQNKGWKSLIPTISPFQKNFG